MKRLASVLGPVLALVFSGSAFGQVESHCLGPQWPIKLLPKSVLEAPSQWSEELSAPLEEDKLLPREGKTVSEDVEKLLGLENPEKGRSEATKLADMLDKPRQVVGWAGQSQWPEAAEAGRKLLEQPREAYYDFTWDYLINATAWSLVQLGQLDSASAAHRAALGRVDDPAVKEYHQRWARLIEWALKPADAKDAPADGLTPETLKDAAKVRRELRKGLIQEAEQIKRSLQLLTDGKTVDTRLGNLDVAYTNLRQTRAIDPEVAGKLLGDFRAACDTLVTDAAAKLQERATTQHQVLVRLEENYLKESDFQFWNGEVEKMWSLIREVKRLCRIHDYLKRLNLAGAADAAALFKEAHELLYAPGPYREIYKTVGGKTVTGDPDRSRRGPSKETPSKVEQRQQDKESQRPRRPGVPALPGT